jgi:TIR domain
MSVIFINYRRDDSAAYAGRIYDRLANHFGYENCFMDIDHIAPGEDFKQVIQEKLSAVQVAVVLIGKQWLNIKDSTGQRRLDNPDDFIQLEIATLLARDIRVIPVLVGGADVPDAAQLPESLVSLVERNAHEISDLRFHTDVDRLIQALEEIVDGKNPQEQSQKNHKSKKVAFAVMLSIMALIIVVGVISNTGEIINQTTQNGDTLTHQGDGDINTVDTITQITDGGNAINQKTIGSNSPAISNTQGEVVININATDSDKKP